MLSLWQVTDDTRQSRPDAGPDGRRGAALGAGRIGALQRPHLFGGPAGAEHAEGRAEAASARRARLRSREGACTRPGRARRFPAPPKGPPPPSARAPDVTTRPLPLRRACPRERQLAATHAVWRARCARAAADSAAQRSTCSAGREPARTCARWRAQQPARCCILLRDVLRDADDAAMNAAATLDGVLRTYWVAATLLSCAACAAPRNRHAQCVRNSSCACGLLTQLRSVLQPSASAAHRLRCAWQAREHVLV